MITLIILFLLYLTYVIITRSKVVESTHEQIKSSYKRRIIFGIIMTVVAIVLIIYGCNYKQTSFFDAKGIFCFLFGFFTIPLSIIGCIISFFRWKKFSNMTEAEYIEYQKQAAQDLEDAEEASKAMRKVTKNAQKIDELFG